MLTIYPEERTEIPVKEVSRFTEDQSTFFRLLFLSVSSNSTSFYFSLPCFLVRPCLFHLSQISVTICSVCSLCLFHLSPEICHLILCLVISNTIKQENNESLEINISFWIWDYSIHIPLWSYSKPYTYASEKEHRKQNMTDGGKPLVSPRGGYPKSGYIQAAQKIGPVILSIKTNDTCTLSKILARQMRFD